MPDQDKYEVERPADPADGNQASTQLTGSTWFKILAYRYRLTKATNANSTLRIQVVDEDDDRIWRGESSPQESTSGTSIDVVGYVGASETGQEIGLHHIAMPDPLPLHNKWRIETNVGALAGADSIENVSILYEPLAEE